MPPASCAPVHIGLNPLAVQHTKIARPRQHDAYSPPGDSLTTPTLHAPGAARAHAAELRAPGTPAVAHGGSGRPGLGPPSARFVLAVLESTRRHERGNNHPSLESFSSDRKGKPLKSPGYTAPILDAVGA